MLKRLTWPSRSAAGTEVSLAARQRASQGAVRGPRGVLGHGYPPEGRSISFCVLKG